MKLVYFIILTFISMADIDTSLCLFPEHCERENNPVAGMASTYYYYWFTTIVMYVLCKSWLSNSTHFGICLKPIANNPLYTIVMLNHSVWIWTPPWIGGCRVIGFINACKWFMEFKLEVQSLHCYCFLWAILIAWLSYLLLTSIIYMVLLFLRSTLYYNYFSRCCIMFLWDIFSPLQNCWGFEALKFLGHSNSKRNSIMYSGFVWYLFILPFQFWILHHSYISCLCIFQWEHLLLLLKNLLQIQLYFYVNIMFVWRHLWCC